MTAILWALRLAVVLVLVWFAVRNSQVVTLNGLPGQSWQAPLVFALLIAFVVGVVVGLLAWLPTAIRHRRDIARLKRQSSAIAAPAPDAPGRPEARHGV